MPQCPIVNCSLFLVYVSSFMEFQCFLFCLLMPNSQLLWEHVANCGNLLQQHLTKCAHLKQTCKHVWGFAALLQKTTVCPDPIRKPAATIREMGGAPRKQRPKGNGIGATGSSNWAWF